MTFLLATCGMIRPTPGGDPAACPGLGHECDYLPASILSPPGGLDSGFVPSAQDLNKKLTEADAYLQILIGQLKKIETLKETTNSVTESVKHCIVLLQVAKDHPLEPVVNTVPSQTSEQHPSSLPVGSVLATLGHYQTPTPNSIGTMSTCLQTKSQSSLNSSNEDEFYDTDEFHQSGSSPKHLIDSSGSASIFTHSCSGGSLKHPDVIESLNSSVSNGTSDADLFDLHDDRDDEGEAGSVEEHKSIIMHLLSQVRFGMDLTKVVLPTFILEKRSLLEMYADFFTYPDLFVVKRYLSTFHAGRKGSVTKKPYNPILGEIFQCQCTLPNDTEENAELVSEGPVPWVSKNSITFVAEQVSHHPPISAFYAECFIKKIQFRAHIWTKSKFLGMSIGVHNIGQGCVSCLEREEHYILTFPNGYGRSGLTVPWVELGGESNINCSKTGYSANIIFHTKPFCGAKKHRITPEIFSPSDKKSFCSIEGEWNGVMYAKYSTGGNIVFIDTKKLPIMKKVTKLEEQNEYESRSRYRLEERQRAEAQERKEKEIQWETRLFHEDGEWWVYSEPLLKHLGAAKH
ncbi:hypothetical protein FD754_014119 [Muntiacus muntjak]|uniref:Oxysterol-binding protein n=1 Tax=Muntiacus muntjak TaxID=9888 RepID=A0A5N3VJA5_MUNMU|nr:hypothetical protein FD754_014119 [Muntiacus muntjak]